MSSHQTLLVLVIGFWTAWFILCIVFKRSWIPVIPFVPLVAFGLGLGLNKIHEWAGTAVVGIAHMLVLLKMIRPFVAKTKRKSHTE
jgi:hypothetical protein